jgi:hypothetical protein
MTRYTVNRSAYNLSLLSRVEYTRCTLYLLSWSAAGLPLRATWLVTFIAYANDRTGTRSATMLPTPGSPLQRSPTILYLLMEIFGRLFSFHPESFKHSISPRESLEPPHWGLKPLICLSCCVMKMGRVRNMLKFCFRRWDEGFTDGTIRINLPIILSLTPLLFWALS